MRHTTVGPIPGTAVASASPPNSSPSAAPNRRRFLLTLGAGGASVAAAVATLPAAAVVANPESESETPDAGYRVTAHVRDYYRTCKL